MTLRLKPLTGGRFQSYCEEAPHTSSYGMDAVHSGRCGICDANIGEGTTVCPDCEKSFESVPPVRTDSDAARFDPEKYRVRMFPWEPIKCQLALINSNRTWLILAVGLALIVTLLALFRTPLPSCWEISP